jgi:hypothetical protein
LVLVLLRRVVLGYGVVDVEFAPTYQLPLEMPHCILRVADVKIRYHNESSMLALGVHGTDGTIGLKQRSKLFVLNIRIDVSHKEGTGGMFTIRMLAKRGDIRHPI